MNRVNITVIIAIASVTITIVWTRIGKINSAVDFTTALVFSKLTVVLFDEKKYKSTPVANEANITRKQNFIMNLV